LKRIKPIDGLRALAAFGVIWIHCWSFCGNPALPVFSMDLYRVMAIVGNGVDFFFVISGFCMYLMIDKGSFSPRSYLNFLYKRFLRIAPAFFASVLVYGIIIKVNDPGYAFWYNVFFHFVFLNNIVTGNTISGPFWSIGVEWHFYMLLPLVIAMSNKISVIKTVIILTFLSTVFFCIINIYYNDVNWWENQVFIRFPEFGYGIIAAYLYLTKKRVLPLMRGIGGLIIGFFMMYMGRVMMYTSFLEWAGPTAFFFKSVSYSVMTIGFAFMMYHVITEHSLLSKFLSIKFLSYFGKISYSIYLWHSLSFIILFKYLSYLKSGSFNVLLVFISVSILTIIIAHFSYKFLESIYFNRQRIDKKPPAVYAT
jgi:peptidoglycan/LPS O-acetylase OafA/YrhL